MVSMTIVYVSIIGLFAFILAATFRAAISSTKMNDDVVSFEMLKGRQYFVLAQNAPHTLFHISDIFIFTLPIDIRSRFYWSLFDFRFV